MLEKTRARVQINFAGEMNPCPKFGSEVVINMITSRPQTGPFRISVPACFIP